MAGNNIIQVLRGNNITTTAGNAVLLPGQPAYDMTTGHLYIGDESGANLANKLAINATYANEAGHADSADTASNATYASNARYASNAGRASTADTVSGYLYLNNGTSQVNWDGNENTTIYVPRTKGSSGQVWGMNGSNVGWINQTEVPGTIEHANTADSADYATSAGSATTATTANKTRYSLYLDNGSTNVAWNGSASNVIYVPTSRGANGQVWTTTAGGVGWEFLPTPEPGNLSDVVHGRYVSLNNSASVQFTRQTTETGIPNAYYSLPYVSGTSSSNPANILINGTYVNTFKSFGYYNSSGNASNTQSFTVNVSKSGAAAFVNNNSIFPFESKINNYAFISFACDYYYKNTDESAQSSHLLPVSTMPVKFFYDYVERSAAMTFCTEIRWFEFEPVILTNGRLSLGNIDFGGGESDEHIKVTVTLAGNLAEVV